MSEELFPEVHPRAKKKHDLAIRVVLCVAGAALLCLVCAFVIYVRTELSFRNYFSAFSDSAVYAYENAGLRVEVDGKSARMNGENAYQLCKILTYTRNKSRKAVPEETPGMSFTFGDGASLEIWEVEPDFESQRSTAVLWRYESPEGKSWIYISDYFTYDSIYSQTVAPIETKLGLAG